MMAMGLILAAAAFFSEVQAAPGVVRLGQVADLSGLPEPVWVQAARIPVAVLPPGRTRITLTVQRLADRVRAQAPALGPVLRFSPGERITISAAPSSRTEPPVTIACARLARTIEGGRALTASELAPETCGAGPFAAPYRYDASARTARATRTIHAGEIILAPPVFAVASLASGEPVAVEASVGFVRVSRLVYTMRPATADRPLLVRPEGGKGFVAPGLEAAP